MSAESSTTSTRTGLMAAPPAAASVCAAASGRVASSRSGSDALVRLPAGLVNRSTIAGRFRIRTTRPSPEDGGAADQIGGDGLIVERLDDQLFLAIESIHNQAQFPVAAADDQHEDLRWAASGPAARGRVPDAPAAKPGYAIAELRSYRPGERRIPRARVISATAFKGMA